MGIAERFQKHGPRVGPDSRFDRSQVVGIHERRLYAVRGQRMRQQIVGAAVNRVLGDDMAALLRKRLDDVRDGGGARGDGQRSHAPFQSRYPFFQHILGRIGQAAVNVARIRQSRNERRHGRKSRNT